MTTTTALRLTPGEAFDRYEAIRPRLPIPVRQGSARAATSLEALFGSYDLFVLDSFGVLNVGDTPIPGAVARVNALRKAGKSVAVLTNAAAQPQQALLKKYHRLGFDFQDSEVISSRSLALEQLTRDLPDGPIAVIGDASRVESADIRQRATGPMEDAAALLFLDAAVWGARSQDSLVQNLSQRLARGGADRPCPVFVANPDLVAPRESGLSLEPGHFAHDLMTRCGADIRFFGKPFGAAFTAIETRFPHVPPNRIVMVGDTLQTDILGGLACGWGTALVSDHGALQGLDVPRAISQSGLSPDWVIPSI